LCAFAEARRAAPNIFLEILGDGPRRSELERLAFDLGIDDAVRFHGSSLDVPAFLSRIDVFVLCSLSEGLPLTVLEAMAAARPIIGTSVGAIPDLVTSARCGWVCPPGDAERLAECMIEATQAKNFSRLGMNGRNHVLQQYSVEQMVHGYERLFEHLLRRPQNNPMQSAESNGVSV
jgi:glycosyltransferase involved in cell wall biosynthesis